MKVIFIGSDRSIFEEGSAARARMVEYGKLFSELHIIVFTKRNFQFPKSSLQKISNIKYQISKNIWVYPTRSWCRWMYPFDATRIAKKIISNSSPSSAEGYGSAQQLKANSFVVSAQDPFEAGLAAKWATRNNGAKLHIQIHTDFLSPFFKKQSLLNCLRLLIAGKVLPCADGIRVVSPRIRDSLTANPEGKITSYGAGNSKLKASPVILPIFVEKEKFANGAPYDFKKDHPDWTFAILTVGRLEAEKNFELAIRTLKIVCQKYPHTGLTIIGGGRERNKLEKFADSLGLSRNVFFTGEQKDLQPFYRGVDIYLQTSDFEGFGMAATEAGYVGLPVVMTDVGVAGWLFKDGENSKVCSVGDEKCLASSIVNLIEDNGLRERLHSKLLADFGKELSQTKMEYLERYRKSIESCFF